VQTVDVGQTVQNGVDREKRPLRPDRRAISRTATNALCGSNETVLPVTMAGLSVARHE
jgi:hypothetical protein